MSEVFVTCLGISLSVGILAAALMLLSPLFGRRYAARWRFWVWVVLAVRLLIPFRLSLPERATVQPETPASFQNEAAPAPAQAQAPVQAPAIVISIPPQITEPIIPEVTETGPDISLLGISAAVWLFGAGLCFLAHISSYLIYRRKLLGSSDRVADTETLNIYSELRGEMGIRAKIRLIRSGRTNTPMMIGFLRPVLVLPESLPGGEPLRFIIKHELVHFKRRDVWFKLLFVAAKSLHWFNPVVWLIAHQAAVDMELSCDEGVVKGGGLSVRKAYSEALFTTVSGEGTHTSLSTGFNGGNRIMKKRFQNILSKFNKRSGAIMLAVVAVLAVAVGAAVVLTVNKPEERINAVGLMSKLRETVGEDTEVYAFVADDFDGDGSLEAFGAVGECYFDGTLYFVTSDGAEEVRQDGFSLFPLGEDSDVHLLDFGDEKFYEIEQCFGGSGRFALVYGVRNGEWFESEISGRGENIRQISGTNDMTIVDGSGFDLDTDENGNEAGGHTRKTYYLNYSGGEFKEYGGTEISEFELIDLADAGELLSKIREGGAEITEIFSRPNGIININYCYHSSDGWTTNKNMTLKISQHEIVSSEEGDGIYRAAFLEDIAVYDAGVLSNSFALMDARSVNEMSYNFIKENDLPEGWDCTFNQVTETQGIIDVSWKSGEPYALIYVGYIDGKWRETATELYLDYSEFLKGVGGGEQAASVSKPFNVVLDPGYTADSRFAQSSVFSVAYNADGEVINAHSYDNDSICTLTVFGGKPVIFVPDSDGLGQLYLLDPETRIAEPLLSGDAYRHSFEEYLGLDGLCWCAQAVASPNGDARIAYVSNKYFDYTDDTKPNLGGAVWVYDLASRNEVRLPLVGSDGVANPKWNGDGSLEYSTVGSGGKLRIVVPADDPIFEGLLTYQRISVTAGGCTTAERDSSGWSLSGNLGRFDTGVTIPSDWIYTGGTTASNGSGKVFEISPVFPAEEYSPEIFRLFPEGTEYPRDYETSEGESVGCTVLEEIENEWSEDAPYLLKSRRLISFPEYDCEKIQYVVRDGDMCAVVSLWTNDGFGPNVTPYFDNICFNVLRWIEISESGE